VGEKYVDVKQLKECLTYYALANRFSLWFYRSETDKLIAKCGQRLEVLKDPSEGKQRRFSGNLFEVRNSSKAFKVDESLRTCSCRIWKLSRITCPHAVAVIFKLNRWAEDYLPNYFRKEMHIQAYNQYLTPVDGMSFWPECGCKKEKAIKPPKPSAKKGRPKKTSVEEPHIVDVSKITAFVNVVDVEGSNAPEVRVDNVGHVRGSSIVDVRFSGKDN
nr:pentatricopeptide repeat-containing protein [Tanacetum cinerariifolium]